MVVESRAKMNKFVYGKPDIMKKEFKGAILVRGMDISRLMNFSR